MKLRMRFVAGRNHFQVELLNSSDRWETIANFPDFESAAECFRHEASKLELVGKTLLEYDTEETYNYLH
jgi:hypothetical protein